MNSYVQQIYNAAAKLPGQVTSSEIEILPGPITDRMDRHYLLTSIYRMRVALGEINPAPTESAAAANAYMAGYENASE